MVLYLLKDHEGDLLQMNFEQILSFVSDKPKQLLSYPKNGEEILSDKTLYSSIKGSVREIKHTDFLLQRLEQEFMDSL